MSLPYFPMYPTDFEAKTSHLTLEEDGAYNRLLRLMWMTPGCSLPDDDAWIMRRMRCDAETYARVVLVVIDEFCTRKSGRVTNPRLAKEWQKTDLAHRKRVEAGSMGGKAKAMKTNKTEPTNAKAMPYQPEPEPDKEERTNVLSKKKTPTGDFDEFWKLCPRKVGKGSARPAYAKALRKTDAPTLLSAMQRYAASVKGKEKQFIPHPSTWLNDERWEDEAADGDEKVARINRWRQMA